MNQLNWQPSDDGGERAEANGFEYICTDNSDEPAIFGELIIKFNGTQLSQDHFDQQQNAGYRKQKRTAQAHADAIALSSKASTIDVEKCAGEIYYSLRGMTGPGLIWSTTDKARIKEVQEIIRKHLKPASESACTCETNQMAICPVHKTCPASLPQPPARKEG